MEKNKTILLASLTISFLLVAVLQIFLYPDSTEPWLLFEILTVLAAIFFYIPGAIIASAVSIGVGLVSFSVNLDVFLRYGHLFVGTGLIGWYASRQQVQQAQLGRLLMVDRLTGLHNYSYFIDRLEEERKRADRFGSRLSLIMLDIDHFKPFNDKYGHQKGNELLKSLAIIFNDQIRGVDIVSRYGGEEFAVLLPNTGHAAALDVAERIRAAVEEAEFPVGNEIVKRTISAGVATYPDDAEDDLRLIDMADEALYEAKESGRNLVVIFNKNKQEALT